MKESRLSHEYLIENLSYDCDTGLFTRLKVAKDASAVGKVAGTAHNRGYVTVGICGEKFLAHRLAWFYVHKVWPVGIDHINRIRSDNRLSNLREATQSQNTENRGPNRKNASPYGMGIRKDGNRFVVHVGGGNNKTYIGCFETLAAAKQARVEAKARLHQFHPQQN